MIAKIQTFEYFLKKLVDWHCEFYEIELSAFNGHTFNDLSKLKVIKLHFFTCSTSVDALNFFDDFHAMPYGHVESTVYNHLNQLIVFHVNSTSLTINSIDMFNELSCAESEVIDRAVEDLKNINRSLISLKPFELVELSHKWFSWRYNFRKARDEGAYSKPIDKKLIIEEEKFYSLV